MAHHPNLLPGIVASNVVNATAPATPSPPSVTNSCTNAVFTWAAPANNGSPITQYGWQYSSNNGSTYANEIITTNTSEPIGNQYSTTAYVVRVRAYNAIGVSAYSTPSAQSTVWAYSAYNADYGISRGCSAGCFCGTQYGTEYGTQSRTCYQWTKAGCTSLTGQNCTLGGQSYSGGCQGMSGCGSFNQISTSNAGSMYIQYLYGGSYRWIYDTGCCGFVDLNTCELCNCSSEVTAYHNVYQCSSTGEKRYVFAGCQYYEP